MPVTYNLIASNTLSSSAASVTFSAIPNTYTDLVVRASVRTNATPFSSALMVSINSITTGYSQTIVRGNSQSASSLRYDSNFDTKWFPGAGYVNANSSTANTFGNNEFYLPSYTSSVAKVAASFGVQENNSSTQNESFIMAGALLNSTTATISSLTFLPNGGDFVSGSSFFLYGIKNT